MKMTIRSWTLDDAQSLAHNANNKNVSRYLRNHFPYPYTLTDAESFISMAMSETRSRLRAIDIDGEAVGGIGLHAQSDVYAMNAELGYWLGEQHWGKGIMTRAVEQMLAVAFQEMNLMRVFASTFAPNTDSARVLEKNHFVREGHFIGNVVKDGAVLDSYMYAIRREQWEALQQR